MRCTRVAVTPCKHSHCKDPTWNPGPPIDCSGVVGMARTLLGVSGGYSTLSFTEICGTPGYLAPEILQCSMDDEHQGYGKEVDM